MEFRPIYNVMCNVQLYLLECSLLYICATTDDSSSGDRRFRGIYMQQRNARVFLFAYTVSRRQSAAMKVLWVIINYEAAQK